MRLLAVIVGLALIGAVVGFFALRNNKLEPQPVPVAQFNPPQEVNSLSDVLNASKGNNLILLLGIEGCPGTKAATEEMTKLAAAKPSNLALLRLDVPTTDFDFQPNTNWTGNFPQRIDNDRKIASELQFVFYPTIFIFDKDGNKRYSGGYDPENVTSVLNKIAKAKAGDKTDYTVNQLAKGTNIPEKSLPLLDGKSASLTQFKGEKGLLVFFGRTGCPFSTSELNNLPDLAAELSVLGISLAVVNMKEQAAKIASIYGDKIPDLPVLVDADGSYSSKFGVDVVPYFYLLDADMKVSAYGPFSSANATNCVKAMLGLGSASVEPIKAAGG